ncbi:hypothetical protein L484_014050 [Morus notabilis]|uniref:Uncharacterized protein n=1 Tax=Morus notabilis TaxID=981085 RepID=W9QDN2_9ROSA|nr:hypothetical protein L484_014050 [Morus notabilis]
MEKVNVGRTVTLTFDEHTHEGKSSQERGRSINRWRRNEEGVRNILYMSAGCRPPKFFGKIVEFTSVEFVLTEVWVVIGHVRCGIPLKFQEQGRRREARKVDRCTWQSTYVGDGA